MNEYLSFRKMITPLIIQILFWVGVAASVITGLIIIIVGETASNGGSLSFKVCCVWFSARLSPGSTASF